MTDSPIEQPAEGGDPAEDQLQRLVAAGEEFMAIGEDGEGNAVIAVAVPPEKAEALTGIRGVSVGRIEEEEIDRLALAFITGEEGDQEAFVIALAPAVPEERAHLATLARAGEAHLVVIEVPGGARRAMRPIEPAALDQLRDLARESGIEGA